MAERPEGDEHLEVATMLDDIRACMMSEDVHREPE
jgi:hypothetical protein